MSTPTATNATTGIPLASLHWLLAHHEAKILHRCRVVSAFPIRHGDLILDLGCGPGLWTGLLAEKVGIDGHIIGIDNDSALLAEAERRNQVLISRGIASFRLASIDSLPSDLPRPNMILCSNCYCYVRDVTRTLLDHWRLLRPSGVLVARHFDNGATVFSCISPDVQLEVLHGVALELKHSHAQSPFNNYLGRHLLTLFSDARLPIPSISTEAVQLAAPLSPSAEEYLRLKGLWHGQLAKPHISPQAYRMWLEAFSPTSPRYILHDPSLYFATLEMQALLVKEPTDA